MRRKIIWGLFIILLLAGGLYIWRNQPKPETENPIAVVLSPIPTAFSIRTPEIISIDDSPLKKSIIASGDYLMRQQLPNGELAYQVNFLTDVRAYTPSEIRLIAGTGSLYTVCKVSKDTKYCDAGDLALGHYLELLVSNPQIFKGTCFYTNGGCPLGATALTIDVIYKRWQANSDYILEDTNLLNTAIELGYFIVSMRKPAGGFYHLYDPHFEGMVNEDFYDAYFSGESVMALLQLYEMTENEFWLMQAREINQFMLTQPITEDHWHSYAFLMFARLDTLTQADVNYATEIANVIIAGQVRSLNPVNTSISTATKIEALSAIAQAFTIADIESEWLDREIRSFITFVLARQIPNNNCNFEITAEMIKKYNGGIFSSCDDPSIRVDGLQHWINGLTAFLEYESMIEGK